MGKQEGSQEEVSPELSSEGSVSVNQAGSGEGKRCRLRIGLGREGLGH